MGTAGDATIDLETVSRNLMEPVLALDADGSIAFANERFIEVAQCSREEVTGADLDVVDRVLERGCADVREAVAAVTRGDAEEMRVELTMVHPAGAPVPERLPAEARVTPIREDGRFLGVLVVFRNISIRRDRERQLERQNERLAEFASVVAHDLRNPMNVAVGYLELAAEDCESEHLASIGDALTRMNAIVDGTLTLAEQGQRVGEQDHVVLADVVERAWGNVDTGDAELVVDGDLVVGADLDRLESLLENLFRNAVEHGGPGITVRVGPLDGEGFFVEDDGVGIPEGEREQAFELGYSGTAEGTGFGLAIVRWIAEAHGWDVSLTEGTGDGARFEVTGVKVA